LAAIISIHSFRGGTGKSNISANLATCLAKSGLRTAVIDTDIQSPGIHVIFGVDQANVRYCLNDYLWGKCGIEEASYDVSKAGGIEENGRLFLIPSSLRSGEIARILREGYDVALLTDGFQRLIKQLKLDCLLIDTHPGVNEETLLSVAISDLLIVVLRPDNQDFQGTAVTVELARKLDVKGMLLLLNKVPPGTDLGALIAEAETAFNVKVATTLPLSSDVARAGSGGVFCVQRPDHPFSRGIADLMKQMNGVVSRHG
jgi:MinD-like ATPase involved in chromosome partitioning or flagellar assembly